MDCYADPYVGDSSLLLDGRLVATAASDLDGDGSADLAVELVTRPGGRGAFYTVHWLVGTAGSGRHIASTFVGDRIRVQSVEIKGTVVTVRLLDRHIRETFDAEPSLAVVRRFALRSGEFSEAGALGMAPI